MKASVSYLELEKILHGAINQPISFEFVDSKTIKVIYELDLAIIKKKIGINIKVLDLLGTDLKVSYSDSGMDGLVGMALKLFKEKIPVGLLEELPNHQLMVHLGSIEQIRPVFEHIEVKDINMLTDALELVGDFKA